MTQRVKRKPINEQPVSASNKIIEKKLPVPKTGISSKMKLCIVLGMLSFLAYANTLRNGYAMDDNLFIANNSLVNMGVKGIPELLTTPHMKGIQADPNDTYRPLSLVMFAIEKDLFGNDPISGHLINILLFAGCVILLFLFLDQLMEQKKTAVAFIAALLFAVHPVHTEVVANIKSRDELLCFFFAFWSLNSFIIYFANGKNVKLGTGILTLFLSLLSKETSISFTIIIPLIFFFYCTGNKKRSTNVTVASLIITIAFLSVRAIVLHGILPSGNNALPFIYNQLVNVPAGASRLATAIFACGYYIKLLFAPYPLLCDYSFSTIPFVSFSDARVWLSLMGYLLLTVTGFYRLIKFKKDPWAFGILFFLVTIALFTNIFFLIPAIFAERFVFFASAGFCLLIALLMEKWFFNLTKPEIDANKLSVLTKTKVLLFLVPLIIVFGSMTVSRNKDWEDNYILFKTDAEKAIENARLYRNAGAVLNINLNNKELRPDVKSRMIEKGIDYLKKSIAIYWPDAEAHAGLGQFYIVKKMFDSAELHEKIAMGLDSMNELAVDNLGVIYSNTNRFSEALPKFIKVLQMDPKNVAEYRNIGLCYLNLREYDSAILNFRRALAAMPENSGLLYKPMAISFREMGKMDSAIKYEQR